MPFPKLVLSHKYLTTVQTAKRLSLSRFQLLLRIDKGIFPAPTYIDNASRGSEHVRYFDENWVKIAQAILDNALVHEKRE